METMSAIVVKLPEVFGAKAARKLGRELKNKVTNSAPHVVIDFSRVKKIDLKGLEALLSCMEEVVKQDGAVQFGGMSPEAATLLELTRMNRLFEKFPGFAADAPAFELSPEPVSEEAEGSVQVPVAA
jgi:anti-sigma B factor antagonist